jgi:alpha-D-xyloside xylohydrolase
MNSENKRDVYIPEGKWVNFFDGSIVEGNKWLKNFEVPLDEMPVWVKYGAEVPYYPEQVSCTDEMDLKKAKTVKIDNTYKGYWQLAIANSQTLLARVCNA